MADEHIVDVEATADFRLVRSPSSGRWIVPFTDSERKLGKLLQAKGKRIVNKTSIMECLEFLHHGYELSVKDNDSVQDLDLPCDRPSLLKSKLGQHLVWRPVQGFRSRIDLHPEIPLDAFIYHFVKHVLAIFFNTSKPESCGLAAMPFNAVFDRVVLRGNEVELDGANVTELAKVNTFLFTDCLESV
jgi:hypothetical protein